MEAIFEKTLYLSALQSNFVEFCSDKQLKEYVKNNLFFQYGKVNFSQFAQTCESTTTEGDKKIEGWQERKIVALPRRALRALVKTIIHLAQAILSFQEGNKLKAKIYAFCAARNLQEAFGQIAALVHDKYGLYHIQESRAHCEFYTHFLRNKTPSQTPGSQSANSLVTQIEKVASERLQNESEEKHIEKSSVSSSRKESTVSGPLTKENESEKKNVEKSSISSPRKESTVSGPLTKENESEKKNVEKSSVLSPRKESTVSGPLTKETVVDDQIQEEDVDEAIKWIKTSYLPGEPVKQALVSKALLYIKANRLDDSLKLIKQISYIYTYSKNKKLDESYIEIAKSYFINGWKKEVLSVFRFFSVKGITKKDELSAQFAQDCLASQDIENALAFTQVISRKCKEKKYNLFAKLLQNAWTKNKPELVKNISQVIFEDVFYEQKGKKVRLMDLDSHLRYLDSLGKYSDTCYSEIAKYLENNQAEKALSFIKQKATEFVQSNDLPTSYEEHQSGY